LFKYFDCQGLILGSSCVGEECRIDIFKECKNAYQGQWVLYFKTGIKYLLLPLIHTIPYYCG